MVLPVRTSLKAAPSNEPITLSEAKAHLRVDTSADDTLITNLIAAARKQVEDFTRRALVTQTWEVFLDGFPHEGLDEFYHWRHFDEVIELPWPPLQSVNSVTYTDTDGNSQTWSSSKYQTDTKSEPGRLRPVHDESYPDTQEETLNAVTIEFDAGYGVAGDVPQPLKQAMFLLIGEMYERREQGSPAAIEEVPFGAKALMGPYRIVTV